MRERPQRDVRRGQVAQQVGGEDAVELPGDAGRGEVLRVAVHEPHAVRPLLELRLAQHLHRRVDGDDLGLRRDLQQGRRRCPGAAAEVEQPQAATAVGQAHALGGEPQVVVVAGVGADQPVVAAAWSSNARGTDRVSIRREEFDQSRVRILPG